MTAGKRTLGWLAAAGACFVTAAIGSAATFPALEPWYAHLVKPSWTPPNWVFGPAWTTLYLLMATAAWNVWRVADGRDVNGPLALFGVHLAVNALWSVLFFGMRNPALAMVDLAVLWLLIAALIAVFGRWSRLSSALMAPYLVWVTYAGALNFAIWRMNPS